jgi:hypothetical protein
MNASHERDGMIAGRRRESPWGRRSEAKKNRPSLAQAPLPEELGRLADRVEPIRERVWPVVSAAMVGEDPLVQGAVIAELTAHWLAGHLVLDDRAATERLREELLEAHIRVVRQLIPFTEPDLPAE